MGDVAVADPVGDPVGHRAAALGEVEAGRAAVEDALRVVHLTVAQQVDDRPHRDPPPTEAAAWAAAGQRVDHVLQRPVVVGGGEEPRLEGARRQVDPLVEHRVEERLVGPGVLAGAPRRSRAPARRRR